MRSSSRRTGSLCRSSTSASRYSATVRSLPENSAASRSGSGCPASDSAASRSPAAHPSVRSTSSAGSGRSTPAAANSSRASATVNRRSGSRTSARPPSSRSRCRPSRTSCRVASTNRSSGGARRISSSSCCSASGPSSCTSSTTSHNWSSSGARSASSRSTITHPLPPVPACAGGSGKRPHRRARHRVPRLARVPGHAARRPGCLPRGRALRSGRDGPPGTRPGRSPHRRGPVARGDRPDPHVRALRLRGRHDERSPQRRCHICTGRLASRHPPESFVAGHIWQPGNLIPYLSLPALVAADPGEARSSRFNGGAVCPSRPARHSDGVDLARAAGGMAVLRPDGTEPGDVGASKTIS